MTIDNKEMPFEVEFEIRALYDRTFDAIIENVKSWDKIVAIRLAAFEENGNNSQ